MNDGKVSDHRARYVRRLATPNGSSLRCNNRIIVPTSHEVQRLTRNPALGGNTSPVSLQRRVSM